MARHITTLLVVLLLLTACSKSNEKAGGDIVTVKVWAHAGQQSERRVLSDQVKRFNQANKAIRVDLTFIPERTYNDQVQAAAVAGDLPDLLEFDGPFLYNYVWQQRLQPLDNLLPESLKKDLLPSIIEQGTYRGKLYAVGVYDSGLGLYTRKSILQKTGMPAPDHPSQAWSIERFNGWLKQLRKTDEDEAVIDLKLNYPAEWFTFAFSPVLQSAGADLINRDGYRHALGVINRDQAVNAMAYLQGWLQSGMVDPNVDDAAFVSGRVAASWAGHWEYHRYHDAFGDDLVVVPLPDFGQGSRTGQGSWVWSITRQANDPKAAAAFVAFLLQPGEIAAMTGANSAVPATATAIDRSPLYQKGGPLHLFVQQLSEGFAVPRPKTPAYPVVTSAFRKAFANIRNGENIKVALTRAGQVIEQDIKDNEGYRQPD